MTKLNKSGAANPRRLEAIKAAAPVWQGPYPYSTEFAEVYFSHSDGLNEAYHVFIDGNQLISRWLALAPEASFTIAETGFGTGLNFLAAAQRWLDNAPTSSTLHFIATEKHPLPPQDMSKALAAWPDLSGLSAQLLKQYPALVPGFHRLDLADAENNRRIALTLIFGDTEHALDELSVCDNPAFKHQQPFTIDAWFLDGFAPAKNPDMWTDTLFQAVANLSHEHTTFSTFTTARAVRQSLQAAGFTTTKIAGYCSKREILVGYFNAVNYQTADKVYALDNTRARPHQTRVGNAHFAPPWHIASLAETPGAVRTAIKSAIKSTAAGNKSTLQDRSHTRQAAIIGGGIAGCSTALALARRGWQVTIYEQAGRLATGASGNPQGIIYPRLSPEKSLLSRFNLAALLYAARFYSPFWDEENSDRTAWGATDKDTAALVGGSVGARCGVIVLPEKPSDTELFATIANNFRGGLQGFKSSQGFKNRLAAHQTGPFVALLNRAEVGAICGVQLDATSGLYFPSLGWIAPRLVCEQLVKHPNISLKGAKVSELAWDASGQRWSLSTSDAQPTTSAAVVVLAASNNSQNFMQTRHLPLKAIRGQISSVPATQASQHLRTVICGAGYLAPASGGSHTLGATYNQDTTTADIREVDHQRNLNQLSLTDTALPKLLDSPSPAILDGRASLRCTTPDYLPLIGPAANFDTFIEDFALLRINAHADIPRCGSYWPGLYIHCGLGSRGFTYAPLGAELLAGVINREAPALPRDLQIALHPARFIIRDLKRKRI